MKRVRLFLVAFLLSSAALFGNDTIVKGSGDTLHPFVSSSIRIAKESITITPIGTKSWQIVVDFVFENDGPETSEQVAFVTKINPHSEVGRQINNFETMLNNQPVDFKIETKSEAGSWWGEAYYISTLDFLTGTNRVIHSYRISGTQVAYPPGDFGFNYTLMSGNNWNGPIGEISINVELPPVSILIESNDFFDIRGSIKDIPFGYGSRKLVHNGELLFHDVNFMATEDINVLLSNIEEYQRNSFLEIGDTPISIYSIMCNTMEGLSQEQIATMDSHQLRLLRNSILAWYGYEFSSSDLTDFFSTYEWYLPHTKSTDVIPTHLENRINIIKRYEDR